MAASINAGIVGLGRIVDMHAPGYLRNPNVRIFSICDQSLATVERRAREWGSFKSYTDFAEMLSDEELEFVEILTPHHLHLPMALQAIEAGKHVSVQKPMALSLTECRAMIEAANKKGVTLKVFENFVFYPPYVAAKKLIDEGEIGDIISIRIRLSAMGGGWHVPLKTWVWRLEETKKGGGPTVFDDGFHKFSMAIFFCGAVKNVFGWIDRSIGLIDSPALLSWNHENGILGYMEMVLVPNVECPSKYYGADERIEITGTRGVIYLNQCTGKLLNAPPLVLQKDGKTVGFDTLETDWLASFSGSIAHFVETLNKGGKPSLTGEEGFRVQQFCQAAIASAKLGRKIDVQSFLGLGEGE